MELTKNYPCVVQFAERDTSDYSQILIRYYDRDVCNRHPGDRQVGVLKVGEKHNLSYQITNFDHPEFSQAQPPIIGARIVKVVDGKVTNGIAVLGLDVDVGGGRIVRVSQILSGRSARLYGRHWHVQSSGEVKGWSIMLARTTEIPPKVFKAGDWVGLFISSEAMDKAIKGEGGTVVSNLIIVDG